MENEENICRTCLASSGKLYQLDEPFVRTMEKFDMRNEIKPSFAECLHYCTRLAIEFEYPYYICEECSHALQISYIFIHNALKAHEILKHRLGNFDIKKDLNKINAVDEALMRFRCKICNEKVETKKSLKEHIKLHMDVITYSCQICDFDSKKRGELVAHYSNEHSIEASVEQLKPVMQLKPETSGEVKNETQNQIDEIFAPSEQRLREQEEAERILQELEEKLLKEKGHVKLCQQNLKITTNKRISDDILINPIEYENNAIDLSSISSISSANIPNSFENDVCVGSEFVVLPDGTVKKVVGSDIVIEYINQDAYKTAAILDSYCQHTLKNIVQIETNDTNNTMEIEDIIEEASNGPQIAAVPAIAINVNRERIYTHQSAPQMQDIHSIQPQCDAKEIKRLSKQIKCKICTKAFNSQAHLKAHMLGHNEIPHFFCDQCSFYTFFRKDLTQHYRTKHKIQPTQQQLLPVNKPKTNTQGQAVFSCDMCLYETSARFHLHRHYINEHSVEATEVQLRPTIDNTDVDIKSRISSEKFKELKECEEQDKFKCSICMTRFATFNTYSEHMDWHEKGDMNKDEIIQETPEVVQMETIMTSSINSTNNTISSLTILPMDEVPQVIASEQTIEQTESFDFNGDEMFGDFDDVNSETIGHEHDDDDFGELFLTSEDDLDDLLEEHGNDVKVIDEKKSTPQLRAYCVHCNKRFFSQYHFENHMFIHRGLAPFRCEMCTNLYNTKRAIIRHYKAVHKTIPTRDMIQAKGEKLNTEKPVVLENVEDSKKCTLMCAKCPFESKPNNPNSLNSLLLHLNSVHGVTDDNYILQKLPFECPRCIRSYESTSALIRHLERSHSSETITQQHARHAASRKYSSSNTCLKNSTTTTIPKSGKANSNISKKIKQNKKLKMLLENDL